MLVQRARSENWKMWAAKHEQEELKVGAWAEPALVLLRKKAKGGWTEKRRHVARKIFLEGGWTQKRLFDFVWSDISNVKHARWRSAQRSTGFTTVRNGMKPGGRFSGGLQKVGAKGENVEDGIEVTLQCN